MLKQVVETKAGRTIAVPSVAGGVVYVVPAGRVFNGVFTFSASHNGTVSINGATGVTVTNGTTGAISVPVNLLAGDTVNFSATSAGIIGVESWL